MRVLVFGASTVQGFWDSQGGWADRLKKHYDRIQLQDLSKDIPHVMNLGISGDGSAELIKRVDHEMAARQNDKGLAVIISIGTNSAAILNGRPIATVEQFRSECEEILNIAAKYSDKLLLVGLPAVDESKTCPVPWVDMHFKNARIAEFENAMEQLAAEKGLPFVAIHGVMESRAGDQLQSHDGLHPNDAGHQLIFELVRPALEEMLNDTI